MTNLCEIILNLYRHANNDYSERCSFVSHSIQAAEAALAENENDYIVCACLLHDIGHLIAKDDTGGCGHADHANVGAKFLLRFGFNDRVCALISGHAQAKRYLCFKNKNYLRELSPASRVTLAAQGGPMTRHEAFFFEKEHLFQDFLKIRKYDDSAKLVIKYPENIDKYRQLINKFCPSSSL